MASAHDDDQACQSNQFGPLNYFKGNFLPSSFGGRWTGFLRQTPVDIDADCGWSPSVRKYKVGGQTLLLHH